MVDSIFVANEPQIPKIYVGSLEDVSDKIEAIALMLDKEEYRVTISTLFGIAWDLKQIARWKTSSFGI